MSGTNPSTSTLPASVAAWGAPAVSVLAFVAFLATLTLAYFAKNDTLFTTLCGAAAAMAGTATQFWLGSSSGSQKKDATIATQSQQLAASTPVVTIPGTPAP